MPRYERMPSWPPSLTSARGCPPQRRPAPGNTRSQSASATAGAATWMVLTPTSALAKCTDGADSWLVALRGERPQQLGVEEIGIGLGLGASKDDQHVALGLLPRTTEHIVVETIAVRQQRPSLIAVHHDDEIGHRSQALHLKAAELGFQQDPRCDIAVREDLSEERGQLRDLLLLKTADQNLQAIRSLLHSVLAQEENPVSPGAKGFLARRAGHCLVSLMHILNVEVIEHEGIVARIQKAIRCCDASAARAADKRMGNSDPPRAHIEEALPGCRLETSTPPSPLISCAAGLVEEQARSTQRLRSPRSWQACETSMRWPAGG
eukprot:CAMPEP_0180441738 /NCGR_PEP_ID=MMETSP1036_2-20121128/13781_1 /TAXON_ID=632150 /ORGANISM="Azadinium spinosum, Strain 3D9" /LENGTH=320 /DNA_ID=CAMNT_0022447963 /DNA_START=141 /DNA_END=1101 /DNA_ORIENTATION=+